MLNRRLVCEVLVFLCYYKVPVGQEMVLKAMDQLRDVRKGYGRFDAWLRELRYTLNGRGRMGSMVGASEDYKRMISHGGGTAESQMSEYAVGCNGSGQRYGFSKRRLSFTICCW